MRELGITKSTCHNIDFDGYLDFIRLRKADLKRIAAHSHGAYQLEDIESEILITADEITRKTGSRFNFNEWEQQDQLLAYTYQRLLRYSDQTLRFSTTLDQPAKGSDLPAFIDSVSRGQQENPLSVLEATTDSTLPDSLPRHTIGGAWLTILENCSNRMVIVAYFLKLSLSHSYRCYNHALRSTRLQNDLPFDTNQNSALSPRPWRRERFYRKPEQLSFDFDYTLPLEETNQ